MTGLRGEVLVKAAPILNSYGRDMKRERRGGEGGGGRCDRSQDVTDREQ